MPRKKVDVNMNDLRKLISAYNKDVSIKNYRNSTRQDLVKKLDEKNYEPKKVKGKQLLKGKTEMRRNKIIYNQ